MSNSIINTVSSKTIGSPSSESSGALSRSGDVFANLFQILNSSGRLQIPEGSNAINVEDIGNNVIKTAIDFSKSHLTDPENEIVDQLNVSRSQTLDLIDLKAFKIPAQHTILESGSDSNLISRAIIEIEEISTVILKHISEETLTEIQLSEEGETVILNAVDEIGIEVEDLYDGLPSQDVPQELIKNSPKEIKSFNLSHCY